jgi:RNA polymerase sigma-70 factor, ECF subfamily
LLPDQNVSMDNHNIDKTIEMLFIENFHSLVFTSFGIVKDYDVAKDIVQDVFVKVWQNFENITDTKNLRPYLATAVRNSSFNYLRDQKMHEETINYLHLLTDEGQGSNDEAITRDDLIDQVHRAVNKLPEKWREAFILSKYEKLKYYEVAEKMGISNKTVEKYISKALNFIRLEVLLMIVFF